MRHVAAGAVLVCLGLGVGTARSSAQVVAPEVRRVEFEGNETFPRDSLARAIATGQSECTSWILEYLIPVCPIFGWGERQAFLRDRDVALDVQRLERWYQQRGFRDADVEAVTQVVVEDTPDEDGVRQRWTTGSRPPERVTIPEEALVPVEVATVRFSIVEGRPILTDSIGYAAPPTLALGDLLDDLPIREGDRWSILQLDATRDTLIRRLRNRGYPYADVLRQNFIRNEDPYRARVLFEIEPGTAARYGDIRIDGIQNLDESTVLRTLPFRSGDPFRIDQLFDGQARLFGLDIVRSARVERDTATIRQQATPDSIVPLFVQVNEGDPYRVRTGLGFNSAECANTEARWTSRDFFGGGRVFQLRGRLANILTRQVGYCKNQVEQEDFRDLTWLVAADFSQPWIFSTRNSFNSSIFAERQSVPDIFIRRAVGLQLALVRAVGPRTPLTLSYRPELSTLDAAEVLLCTGLLACSEPDISILTSARRLAPVGINLTRNHGNSLLNPTAGYRLIVDLEHAAPWTGSEFRYDRAVVEGTWYSRLTGASVLATRMRGGWVGSGAFELEDAGQTDLIHPQKRFYAGGANSVRGFGQSRLGPRVLAVDDPGRLVTSTDFGGAGCLPEEIIDFTCDASELDDRFIVSRPIGGTRVIEGNLELRFGLGGGFEAVTFGDFGQVWGDAQTFDLTDLEFTPGVGVRYLSPVGPIRVDVGYSFRADEPLSVVTRQIAPFAGDCTPDPDDVNCVSRITGPMTSEEIQYRETGELAVLPSVLFGESGSRFQLHLSIGQAF